MRHSRVGRKKIGGNSPNTWRLPFGRKTNKYGVLAIYSQNILVLKPDGKSAFTCWSKNNKYGV